MVYQYIACNSQGEVVKGKLSATSDEAVNDILSYAGYKLINLKPYVPFFSLERFSEQLFPIKPTEVILFYRQLALLLESGINIVTSLELLRGQAGNRSMKKVLGEVVQDLRNGSQLSMAMSKHPRVFSSLSCRTLSIGERTGGIETMLRQVADYMEKEVASAKGIKSALMYPMIAGVVAIVVICILVFFVLPSFSNLYGSLGVELPALTRFIMDAANSVRDNAMFLLIGLLAIGGSFFFYIKTEGGRYRLDKLLLSLPLLGRIRHLNELSRCCRSISLLFKAGLPLTEIMPMVIQGCNNKVISRELDEVHQEMLKGEGLSKPMSQSAIFLPMMVQMVKVGEETGNLDSSLLAVAQNYESETEEKTKSLINLIPPAMTLVIAAVVGIIALSLISAMYSIYGATF